MATCGINQGIGPLPSDPDNNVILTVTTTHGGILVRWSYPAVNPEAVAHILIYRNTSATYNVANLYATAKGDRFYDEIEEINAGTEYFYWIRIVSINGTEGALIGPESAIAIAISSQYLDYLTDKIDNSMLAAALRTQIEDIPTLRTEFEAEAIARGVAEQNRDIQVSGIETDVGVNFSGIVTESNTRVTDDTSLSNRTTTLEADVGVGGANINAAIQAYDAAQVGYCKLSTGDISTDPNEQTKILCEAAGHAWLELKGLATAIKTVQIDDGQGGTSTIETFTQAVDTRSDAIEGDVGGLEAQYTIKLQTTTGGANPTSIVGGFGLASTTSGATPTISAGFNVDEFWVADLSQDVASAPGTIRPEFVPFVISGGVVYMKSAFIEAATITNAHIANATITNAKIGDLEVETIKLSNGAITIHDYDETAGINVIYLTTGTNTYGWRSKSAYEVTDSADDIIQLVYTGDPLVSAGTNWKTGSIITGTIVGETYEMLLTITVDIGFLTRSNISTEGIAIHLWVNLQKNAEQGLNWKIGHLKFNAATGYGGPHSEVYTFTRRFVVDSNSTYTYYFNSTWTTDNDDDLYTRVDNLFNTAPAFDGNVLEYIWFQQVTYNATVFLR